MIALSRKYWEPTPFARSLSWFREYIQTHERKPYDHGAYPHIGAPGGPCDALDDSRVLSIWLQWGSRLGKTFFGQSASLFFAGSNPRPLMFASSVEKLAIEVVERTYRMAERCPPVAGQLLSPHKRKQSLMEFDSCRMYVAWSRSVSTLADKPVRFGHANEIDKWEHEKTSQEADPLKLFTDRFKEFNSHKKLFESTPTIKGRSRVEQGRIRSSNCRFYVPCPHCQRYQTLEMDQVKWEHDENGRSDRDIARRTAHYECKHCQGKILDEHRVPMIRLGVWVPEGCEVIDAEAMKAAESWASHESSPWGGWAAASWVSGTPRRDGTEAGYQLSSLYALTLGWGDIAAEFVSSKEKPQDLRNFINQWLAETWEVVAKQQTWEDLGKRLIVKVPRLKVPNGFDLLIAAGDQQQDHCVYVVDAWNLAGTSHTLCYGTLKDRDDLIDLVLQQQYEREDGAKLGIVLSMFDSGYRASGVYDYCARACRLGVMMLPCKGSQIALNAPYKVVTLGDNTARPGAPLVHVDTITTQDWMEGQLHELRAGDPGSSSLYGDGLAEHQDFLEQLLNEAAVLSTDSRNYARETWQRISDSLPNDYRDCRRYSYIGFQIATSPGFEPMRPAGQLSAGHGKRARDAESQSSSKGWEVSL